MAAAGQPDQRRQLATQIGVGGWRLLHAVADANAPAWLRQIAAVDVLRRVWIQQYTLDQRGGR